MIDLSLKEVLGYDPFHDDATLFKEIERRALRGWAPNLVASYTKWTARRFTPLVEWPAMLEAAQKCASPIESLMFTALAIVARHTHMPPVFRPRATGDGRCALSIQPQVPIVPFRVDFLMSASETRRWRTARAYNLQRVVVECDGHDSHYLTKEQILRDRRRDRQLQARGYNVLRYTGSEIYRDAFACANEALSVLFGLHFRDGAERMAELREAALSSPADDAHEEE